MAGRDRAGQQPRPRQGGVGFRLRGEADGSPISVLLRPGTTSVGSGDDCDAVVAATGISRRHAVLDLDETGLRVTDHHSKNGTFVNGVQVRTAPLAAGDWLQLGPVILQVEAVDAADTTLAIPGTAGAPAGGAARGHETEGWARRRSEEPPRWVSLLGRVLPRLGAPDAGALSETLAELAAGLRAPGVALLEAGATGEPRVCGGWGTGLGAASDVAVRSLRPTLAGGLRDVPVTSGLVEGPPPVAWAAGNLGSGRVAVLVVAGEFPARASSRPLLELVVRSASWSAGAPEPTPTPTARRKAGELRFPDGYVRGRSRAMARLHDEMQRLVRGDIPVLILGETGAGKEHAARILHASSRCSQGPFVAINCAAIPTELLEAELFGIEAGVATGVRERAGKLTQADGGTAFLDEIGDLSPTLQAKLLRVLQEHEVHPVGAREPRPTHFRLLTATNTDMDARRHAGTFRNDLYFRLAGFVLRVPPLRERREDIPALVEHFLRTFAREVGCPVPGMTLKALDLLQDAPWPGNVRELEHEVRRLVYLCPDGQAVDSSLLSGSVVAPDLAAFKARAATGDLRLATHVEALERELISAALARARGNKAAAARLLGITRNGLLLKLERLGIE